MNNIPDNLCLSDTHRRILDAILETIRTHYAEDIALFFIHGSVINGTSHDKSDLDMVVVPKTDRGQKFAKTFIMNGVGYDLWNVSMSELCSFTVVSVLRASILADSLLLYYGDEEDKKIYEKLKKNASYPQPLNEYDYEPIMNFISNAKHYYGEFCLSENPAVAGGIVLELFYALSRLNSARIRFGSKKLLDEAAEFPLLPERFIENAQYVILNPKSSAQLCADLIRSVENYVHGYFTKHFRIDTHGKNAAGLYEELASTWNKIRYACGQGDAVYAFMAASALQADLDSAAVYLGLEGKLDLFSSYDPNSLKTFADHCTEIENRFTEALEKAGVPITVFDSADELKEYLISAKNQ